MKEKDKEDRRFQLTNPQLIKFADWYCEAYGVKKMDFTELVFKEFTLKYFSDNFGDLVKEIYEQ